VRKEKNNVGSAQRKNRKGPQAGKSVGRDRIARSAWRGKHSREGRTVLLWGSSNRGRFQETASTEASQGNRRAKKRKRGRIRKGKGKKEDYYWDRGRERTCERRPIKLPNPLGPSAREKKKKQGEQTLKRRVLELEELGGVEVWSKKKNPRTKKKKEEPINRRAGKGCRGEG